MRLAIFYMFSRCLFFKNKKTNKIFKKDIDKLKTNLKTIIDFFIKPILFSGSKF